MYVCKKWLFVLPTKDSMYREVNWWQSLLQLFQSILSMYVMEYAVVCDSLCGGMWWNVVVFVLLCGGIYVMVCDGFCDTLWWKMMKHIMIHDWMENNTWTPKRVILSDLEKFSKWAWLAWLTCFHGSIILFWGQFLTDFDITLLRTKLRTSSTRIWCSYATGEK